MGVCNGPVNAKLPSQVDFGQLDDTSANAEICAIMHAMRWVLASGCNHVCFHYDAIVVGEAIQGFNGWDSDEKIVAIARGHILVLNVRATVEYFHVYAHVGFPWNECADTAAKLSNQGQNIGKHGSKLRSIWFENSATPNWAWIVALGPARRRLQGLPPVSDGTVHFVHPNVPHDLTGINLHMDIKHDNGLYDCSMKLDFATCNVRSLKETKFGMPEGRVELYRKQFEERKFHLVGIQEAKTRKQGIVESKNYIRECAGPITEKNRRCGALDFYNGCLGNLECSGHCHQAKAYDCCYQGPILQSGRPCCAWAVCGGQK